MTKQVTKEQAQKSINTALELYPYADSNPCMRRVDIDDLANETEDTIKDVFFDVLRFAIFDAYNAEPADIVEPAFIHSFSVVDSLLTFDINQTSEGFLIDRTDSISLIELFDNLDIAEDISIGIFNDFLRLHLQ